jgi:hypothetical protein
MALEMRPACERCGASLAADGAAYVCSYECTFCPGCAVDELHSTCPNCGGELVARPKRLVRSPATGQAADANAVFADSGAVGASGPGPAAREA